VIALSQLLRISEDRFDPHILFTTLRMKHPLERTAYLLSQWLTMGHPTANQAEMNIIAYTEYP